MQAGNNPSIPVSGCTINGVNYFSTERIMAWRLQPREAGVQSGTEPADIAARPGAIVSGE